MTREEWTTAVVDALDNILTQCEHKMHLPFVVSVISPNGSCYVIRAHGRQLNLDYLAYHFEPHGFLMPEIITVVDQMGGAAAFRVSVEGIKQLH